MKKVLITIVCLLLVIVLVACGTAKPSSPAVTPEDNSPSVNPSDDTPSTNTPDDTTNNVININKKNEGVVKLGQALDTVKSLEELTGVDISRYSGADTASTSSDDSDDEDTDEYLVDCTNPGPWYYSIDSIQVTSFYELTNLFQTINHFYQLAKDKKNEILNSSNLIFLNSWYQDGECTNRVTYDEENNNLICESFEGENKYSKLSIGWDEKGKLYYSYLYSEFDDVPIFNGLVHQLAIEYFEDKYYNSFEFNRLIEYEFDYDWHIQQKSCVVDLSVERGRFYTYLAIDYYSENTFKNSEINDRIYCFEAIGGDVICYAIYNNDSRFIGLTNGSNGRPSFELDGNHSDGRIYYLYIDPYKLTGIEQIIVKPSETDELAYDKFYVKFNNGKCIPFDNPDRNFNVRNVGGGFRNDYFPNFYFRSLSGIDELLELFDEYGIEFRDIDFEYYTNKLVGDLGYKVFDYEFNSENFYDIVDCMLSMRIDIDLQEVQQEYDNVETIKIPIKVRAKVRIEGVAEIEDRLVDLSKLELVVEEVDEWTEKYLEELDLYLNDSFLQELSFDYEDRVFSFKNSKKIVFDKSILDGQTNVLAVRLSKFGILIEIPFEIVAAKDEVNVDELKTSENESDSNEGGDADNEADENLG
ncbi:MAG: hypothetical protein IK048_01930 [Clostridia bacterium]|nr:hypothetical protein [Clostridia bacterium]